MPRPKKQHLKQRADGRYCCRYKDQWFMGRTEKEALGAREEYKRQQARQEYSRQSPTLTDYSEKWLVLHKKSCVSAKCYRDYEKQIQALYPVIGEKPIDEITVDDAAMVWDHYRGYSASTIKRARMLYIALFDAAIENDLCHKNPFRGRFAQPPKAPSGSHRALTEEEISLIWHTPHRMQLAALIMLYCGLRRGEVLALSSDDIDTKNNVITVDKAVRFDGNRAVITDPKTSAGIRSVPIPIILRPFFDGFSGLVLSTREGSVMTETAWSRCWDSFILHLSNTAGHQVTIRPHDLRHTYCTSLRDAGVDMHQAMIWMGHADEKMILKVYDHVTDTRTQASTDRLNEALS